MILKKLLAIGSLTIFLGACSTTQTAPLEGVGDYENPSEQILVNKVPIQLDNIEPVRWRDFEWTVLNTERVQAMIDNGEEVRYYALTPTDFQNLSLTTQDILRYLNSQREQLYQVLDYYSVDEPESDTDNSNETDESESD